MALRTHNVFLSCFLFRSHLVGFLQIIRQPIERSLPEFAIVFHPLGSLLHRLRFQFQLMNAPIAASPDQSRFFEHTQVFRDGGQRHRMRPRQIGNAPVTARQMRQDPAAGRVRQGGERAVQCAGLIFNHQVNYLAAS
jgi:hypothetical protein